MRDKFTGFIAIIGTLYIALYVYLTMNIQMWLIDVVHCFKVMEFKVYLIDHINIFFYIALFFFMSFYISKMLYILFKELYRFYTLNKYISILKIKRLKNILVIDTEEKLAFNFLNKIVISKSILDNFSGEERKSIFWHEKGHLINGDSYKILFSNLILSLFPEKIKNTILKSYILFLETNADRFALKFIDTVNLAKSLLKFKSSTSLNPMMNNFTEDRLKTMLEGNDIQIPKFIHILIILITAVIFVSIIYKTCLCGIM